jgi:predicted secreted hydrolase
MTLGGFSKAVGSKEGKIPQSVFFQNPKAGRGRKGDSPGGVVPGGISPWNSAILLIPMILLCALTPALSQEWAQALTPRKWTFPRDHGAHPEFRTEWWYFTGNLRSPSEVPYGYQLTFFRQAVQVKSRMPENPWSLRDLYLAHFAITDIPKKRFRWKERISRTGPGLAGASTAGMEVWLLNWSAQMKGSTIVLQAGDGGMELSLELIPRKPVVIHGRGGISRKGPNPGQASYYASLTDLRTRGFLKIEGSKIPVAGRSWFDQEFGSNQLATDQTGWDWLSLYLSDGRDLMLYLLRRADGTIEPSSSGTLVFADGQSRHLELADFRLSVLQRRKSPRSGGLYPSRWRVEIPSAGIDLEISPRLPDQELTTEGSTGVTYWEGAVAGNGRSAHRSVSCEGYVEMTGYAGSLGGIF